ncbi:pilus assembly protein [Wukongibacter baidiensis]|uniref:TadE/TadG family type IV pilus assembly protein n=1 Tax=Wukongibacter baidiensis TaxID=1723361 RepID=UPI003D7F4440
MKSFINKGQRGSLTVEAAIVLPIFICAVLTIGFFTKIVYTHEIIQHAITEAVNEMASSSYLYYTSGVQNIDNTIDSELEEKKQKSQEHLDSITDCYNELNDSVGQLKSDSKNVYEGVGRGDVKGISESISGISSDGQNIKENVGEIQSVIEDIAEDPKGEMISIAALIAKIGYDKGKTAIGNQLIGYYVKKHGLTDERLKSLDIDKLDFSKSSYFKSNEDIDVVVKYNVDIPLPIKFTSNIPIVQRATARAWMGGDDGYSGEGEDENDGEEEDNDENVYVTLLSLDRDSSESEKRYHINASCDALNNPADALYLDDAKSKGLKQCNWFIPGEGKANYLVYKTRGNTKVYHHMTCKHIDIKVVTKSKKEALEEGYTLCQICKKKSQ